MGDARRAGAAVGEPFLMPTENVLTISGRGSVVTGAVERGALRVGDPVEVVGLGPTVAAVATGLETFGKVLHTAQAGDNAGVLLRGVKREQVGAARWLPRSARRGWPAKPFLANYQPQFFIRTQDRVYPGLPAAKRPHPREVASHAWARPTRRVVTLRTAAGGSVTVADVDRWECAGTISAFLVALVCYE